MTTLARWTLLALRRLIHGDQVLTPRHGWLLPPVAVARALRMRSAAGAPPAAASL